MGSPRATGFLRAQLGAIMRSPAWRTQRCLAIVTMDEDAYNKPSPPQQVATVLIASRGVRAGYVSPVRYSHYSLGRTIEAALGLAPLTGSDRRASPTNDVFSPGAVGPALNQLLRAPVARVVPARGLRPLAAPPLSWPLAAPPLRPAARAFAAGRPLAIAVAPSGRLALVADSGSNAVTPIATSTLTAGPPIPVGSDPRSIALAPTAGPPTS